MEARKDIESFFPSFQEASEVGYQGLLGRQTRTTRGSCPGKRPDC